MSRVALHDDVVDRIMTFCSTFDTLRSTVLVSKAFYRVFQSHPKSITMDVAYNLVGPALPQALRVVRYPYHEFDEPYAQYDDTPDGDLSAMAAACPEELHPVITPWDEQALLENSRVVTALEDIYSLQTKDNKSRTSVLTSEESWRFRRAMYRIILYCKLFPCDRYDSAEILAMDDELVGKIRMQRTAVLDEYPTDELRELCSAVKFLVSMFTGLPAPTRLTDTLLSTGPSGALRAWQARSYWVLEDEIDFDFLLRATDNLLLFEGYFSLPLENLCSERSTARPKADDPGSKWILDQVTSATDTCSHCAAPDGIELYTEANWGRRLPFYIRDFLKYPLQHNQILFPPLYALTSHLEDSDALGLFISNLFAFKTHTAPAFDNWERTDSYCQMCLTKFLEEHLWIWFLEERLKGGWIPPENCPYGWTCRTQASDRSHAKTKNHLCVPINDVPA
ncbi:hypothetical protein B0H12DRAFT_1327696 [Mycena haematopus]|nr:hypothetical protein B0H12DRAFT_1327696 [Mycena haematopus]